jgi:hypothetical protein
LFASLDPENIFCDISSRTPASGGATEGLREIFFHNDIVSQESLTSQVTSRSRMGRQEASEERSEKVKRNENGRNKNICSIAMMRHQLNQ